MGRGNLSTTPLAISFPMLIYSSTSKSHQSSQSSRPSDSRDDHAKDRLDRYIGEHRDYKSYAVKEYDPYQQATQRQHQKDLKEIVRKNYY